MLNPVRTLTAQQKSSLAAGTLTLKTCALKGRGRIQCSVQLRQFRVRLLQRSLGNPAETFDTEKNWEYDVPWPVEEVKVEEVVVEKQPVKEKKTVLEKVKRVIL